MNLHRHSTLALLAAAFFPFAAFAQSTAALKQALTFHASFGSDSS
jgi:hypothetical protein